MLIKARKILVVMSLHGHRRTRGTRSLETCLLFRYLIPCPSPNAIDTRRAKQLG